MDKEPRMLFQTLLKQIQLSLTEEEIPYLENGEITSVKVHRQEKLWQFYFKFDKILPFALYQKFESALKVAFSNIANIDINIEVADPQITQELISDYWLYVCQKSGVDSPICNQLFSNSSPQYQEGQLIFYIEHEITLPKFTEEFFPPITQQYGKLGFPEKLKIIPQVNKEAAEKVVQAVTEKNESENAILTKQLTERHQQNERNGNNGSAANGPVKMGRKIAKNAPVVQMEDIFEEERSIVIEGYVFDVEIRKLRSERELIILKITDYTSSLTVKKFSNNETDEAIFAQIKEGM